MKYATMVALVLTMGLSVFAQDNAISKYFSAYQQDDSFTKVSVTSKMFSLFTELDSELEEEKEILEAISKLEGIKGIFKDDVSNSKAMYDDAVKKINGDGGYEELMTVENKDENARFLIKDQNGKISELLMVMGGDNEFIAMSLFGDIDLSAISKMAKVMKIRGLEHFGNMGSHDDGN